jgi:hypothetical protein
VRQVLADGAAVIEPQADLSVIASLTNADDVRERPPSGNGSREID